MVQLLGYGTISDGPEHQASCFHYLVEQIARLQLRLLAACVRWFLTRFLKAISRF